MKLKFSDIILREDDSVSLIRLITLTSFTTYTILYICSFIWNKPMPYFSEYTTFNASIIFAGIGSKVADAKFLGIDIKMKPDNPQEETEETPNRHDRPYDRHDR